MKNILPKHLRKPVPEFGRKWLEAARMKAQLQGAEYPVVPSRKSPQPETGTRSIHADTPDPTP
jgi:hypothetical protein